MTLATFTLPKIIVPFSGPKSPKTTKGYYCAYETLYEEEIFDLPVTPVLTIDDYTGDCFRDLHLRFCPETWDVKRYGLIYTDGVFEDTFQNIWKNIYQFPESYGTPFYTEQGMQGDDFVSMELGTVHGNDRWWAGYESAHQALSHIRFLKGLEADIDIANDTF